MSVCTTARPMPRAPPVTTAICPLKLLISMSSARFGGRMRARYIARQFCVNGQTFFLKRADGPNHRLATAISIKTALQNAGTNGSLS
jgi:hypothetical protein